MDRQTLDRLSREELIETARGLGIEQAPVLTRVELVDEIVRHAFVDPRERTVARGLLGLARDLLADVVERGLHLPDAAARIRSSRTAARWPAPQAPIATVTLAEIYAKQGLRDRALAVLEEVLREEPDHAAARELREKIDATPASAPEMPPEPEPDREAGPRAAPELEDVAAAGEEEAAAAGEEEALPEEPVSAAEQEVPLATETRAAWTAAHEDTVAAVTEPDMAAHEAGSAAPAMVAAEPERVLAADAERGPATEAEPEEVTGVFERNPPERRAEQSVPQPKVPALQDSLYIEPIPGGLEVSWAIRSTTLRALIEEAPGSSLILRLLVVVPAWDGPVRREIDRSIDREEGVYRTEEAPPSAVLRAAIGLVSGDRFVPLAIAACEPRERWRSSRELPRPSGSRGAGFSPIASPSAS